MPCMRLLVEVKIVNHPEVNPAVNRLLLPSRKIASDLLSYFDLFQLICDGLPVVLVGRAGGAPEVKFERGAVNRG